MQQLGPFPLSVALLALALVLGWLTTRRLANHMPGLPARAATGLLADSVLAGLLMARLAYVGWWWRDYLTSPWSVIAIGDGGFYIAAGVPAAVLFVLWASRARHALRRPVLAGLVMAMVVWFAGQGLVRRLQAAAPALPEITLTRLDGRPLALSSLQGQPVVLNLWATWCPPCRREMPVFAQAQHDYPGVAFVMANQGETAQEMAHYLDQQGLQFNLALRDPDSQAMVAVGARALPSTLFFDASGRLVDAHLGELTRASLRDRLARRFGQQPLPPP